MPAVLKKRDLRALDNFSIILQAKQAGLTVYRDDLYINYAEIDDMITSSEDAMVDRAGAVVKKAAKEWLRSIKSKADVDPESFRVALSLADAYMSMISEVWNKGQRSAAQELETIGVEKAGEFQSFRPGIQTFAAGDPVDPDESEWIGNYDAYLWYDLYTKQLAQSTETALFHYMQPKILEHIENGTTSTELADELTADFARYGSVRADIIARTESTKAYNWGRRYRFDSSPAISGYRYSAILDERTTDICEALHGHSWTKDDPALNLYTPPNHYRCRSVIVPIHAFQDWAFDPPPGDWTEDLPEREQVLVEKFSNSEWYPMAKTVAALITPEELPSPPEVPQPPPEQQKPEEKK